MLKNRKRLSSSFDEEYENSNPMENLTNLFDVMLVFAFSYPDMPHLILILN